MPAPMKAAIVEVVKRFPDVTFVWKYEVKDEVGKGVENLVKSKWMPQVDLLSEWNSLREEAPLQIPALSRPSSLTEEWEASSRRPPPECPPSPSESSLIK